MSIRLDRRSIILGGCYGLGALVLPGSDALAQALMTGGALNDGFTHGVASGEPGPNSVLLWTRFATANGDPVHVSVEVSDTPNFTKIVGRGEMITGPWRDYTVKITVDGLDPGRWYYYRFSGPNGSQSRVGRTRTLPVGSVKEFGMAVFSCANIGFGYFNAYAHAARREDVHLAVHLGDYIYEYARGGYDMKGFARVNEIQPEYEAVALADYRMRYGCYRLDPDLQQLHASLPMIVSTDDHEGANDWWEGGAQNHQPDKEGDWNARTNAAMQAWREWLPVGELPWKSYDIGDLATYFRTDSRMIARSRPGALNEILAGISAPKDVERALISYRDNEWMDPAATMFGTEQELWLRQAFLDLTRADKHWQILGSGTTIGRVVTPPEAMSWLKPDASERSKTFIANGIAAAKVGLPGNLDNWGGYPAAKTRLLKAAQSADANLVIVSGDTHNAWAFDLSQDGKPVGVEFGGQSVTSSGMESSYAADPATVAKAIIKHSPAMRWADTSRRGYMKVTLTPESAATEYILMNDVLTPNQTNSQRTTLSVTRNRRQLALN